MTQQVSLIRHSAGIALSLLLSATAFAPAEAGPFGAAGAYAVPGGTTDNIVKLEQISGFTGQLAFGISDGAYLPVGSRFNKLAKFRLSVSCPAGYRVHQAGVRIRGADAVNFDLELLAPGSLGPGQSSWQQVYDNETWRFDAVVAAGAEALSANNNGPVYVSLDKVLDSRTEFYGWCVPSDPLSNQSALYYDSAAADTDLRPMTRVRYQLQPTIAKGLQRTLKAAATLRRPSATGTPPAAAKMKLLAPGGCP